MSINLMLLASTVKSIDQPGLLGLVMVPEQFCFELMSIWVIR